ncbi:AfsR/SARP family transcriptional regulator [Streptomyces bohaiensis]|uniref:AfsR/SARP family transcriptional regulator n=1 Tax=Streptomyces bohaiensis TaxID=1431344 RepID=UPI003B7EA4EB
MLVRVLGPVEVSLSGPPLPLGGPKHRAVLRYLALRANTVVPVDDLLRALWQETLPRTARKMVQNVVSELRAALTAQEWYDTAPAPSGGPGRAAGAEPGTGTGVPAVILLTHGSGYVLRVDPDQVDALRFERLAREGLARLRSGSCAPGLALLREALALWPTTATRPAGGTGSRRDPSDRWPERLRAVELRTDAERHLAPGDGTVLVLTTESTALPGLLPAAADAESRYGAAARAMTERHGGRLCVEFGSLRAAVFPVDGTTPAAERACAAADAVRGALTGPGPESDPALTAVILPGRAAPGDSSGVPDPALDEGIALVSAVQPGTTHLHPMAPAAPAAPPVPRTPPGTPAPPRPGLDSAPPPRERQPR